MNRALGDRIKHLEVQNFHMTAKGFHQTGGTKVEPTRPLFTDVSPSTRGQLGYETEDPRSRVKRDDNDSILDNSAAVLKKLNSRSPLPENFSYGQPTPNIDPRKTSGNFSSVTKNSRVVLNNSQIMYGNSSITESQNMLPRPHHELALSKTKSTENRFNAPNGY